MFPNKILQKVSKAEILQNARVGTAVYCLPEWQAPVWVLTGFACYSARKSRSYHAGACHSGKQCTAVPTSHYLPTAKRTWQAMLAFIHPCNLVGEMPQAPERFQRNRLRSVGADFNSSGFYICVSMLFQS